MYEKDSQPHSCFIKCRSKQQRYSIAIREVELLKFNDSGIRVWGNRHSQAMYRWESVLSF